MDQTTAINHSVLHGPGRGTAAQAALAIFAVSLATLLGAWFFQFVLGYPPCPLCLQQRIPYYIVIPLSLVLACGTRRRIAAACRRGPVGGPYRRPVRRRTRYLPCRRRVAFLGRTDRLLRSARRPQRRRIAARPAQFGPRRPLRPGGVAFSRRFARRL